MTRGPNNTVPMGLSSEADRTEPGAPPTVAPSADPTEPGWQPEATPVMPPTSTAENGTDPGLDPMLEAFNRAPRPPAPQPNLRASSDGDEFAAHYAGPRALRAPHVGPTAHDPAVLVQLAELARTDTARMAAAPASDPALRVERQVEAAAPADRTPDAALPVQRDLETVVVRGKRRLTLRALLIALAVGGLVAAPSAFFVLRSPKSPEAARSAGAEASSALALPREPSAAIAAPSSSPPSPPAMTAASSTPAPPPPVTARSATALSSAPAPVPPPLAPLAAASNVSLAPTHPPTGATAGAPTPTSATPAVPRQAAASPTVNATTHTPVPTPDPAPKNDIDRTLRP